MKKIVAVIAADFIAVTILALLVSLKERRDLVEDCRMLTGKLRKAFYREIELFAQP